MNPQCFQVVLRATEPDVSSNAPIAAARLISLMPDGWSGRLDSLVEDTVVVIETAADAPVEAVVAAAESALADTAMRGWELVRCSAL